MADEDSRLRHLSMHVGETIIPGDAIPNVLTGEGFSKEDSTPHVSRGLIEHLSEKFAPQLSRINMTAEETLKDQAHQWGTQTVISYLTRLLEQQEGTDA